MLHFLMFQNITEQINKLMVMKLEYNDNKNEYD